MSFGSYFKDLRKSKQVTQKEIADAIGKKPMLVSNVENSKNGPFVDVDLKKISVALDLSEDEKEKLYKEAAKASGKLPPHLLDYLTRHDEVYSLLEVLAKKELGSDSLSKIIQLVKESNLQC